MNNRPPESGFSLFEVIIVLSILAMIALFSSNIPKKLLTRVQLTIATSSIRHIIEQSRQLSLETMSSAVLCPSIDDYKCTYNWNNNLIVFIDANGNRQVDKDEVIYHRHYTSSLINIVYTRKIRLLSFHPSGRVQANGSFHICPSNGDASLASALIINKQGRVRVSKDINGDGVVDDAKGKSLVC